MKYLTIHETDLAYESVKESLATPQVALVEEGKVVHFIKGVDVSAGPEMVDLDLPSGLKWAKCNVGADKETDYGMYFQFGDVVGHDAEHCTHDDSFPAVEVDGNNYLLPAYDAATQLMGEGYRMPTMTEIDELVNNTDHAVETINDVKGMKFTNKSDNSKYIFIPFAGCCVGDFFVGVGNRGHLWSSMLNIDDFFANELYCSDDDCAEPGSNNRNNGFSVRGVSE